jgi:hypothetical protein
MSTSSWGEGIKSRLTLIHPHATVFEIRRIWKHLCLISEIEKSTNSAGLSLREEYSNDPKPSGFLLNYILGKNVHRPTGNVPENISDLLFQYGGIGSPRSKAIHTFKHFSYNEKFWICVIERS